MDLPVREGEKPDKSGRESLFGAQRLYKPFLSEVPIAPTSRKFRKLRMHRKRPVRLNTAAGRNFVWRFLHRRSPSYRVLTTKCGNSLQLPPAGAHARPRPNRRRPAWVPVPKTKCRLFGQPKPMGFHGGAHTTGVRTKSVSARRAVFTYREPRDAAIEQPAIPLQLSRTEGPCPRIAVAADQETFGRVEAAADHRASPFSSDSSSATLASIAWNGGLAPKIIPAMAT